MWTVHFHNGSEVSLAELRPLPSPFQVCTVFLNWNFSMPWKLNSGVSLTQGCPSFLRSYYGLSWVSGLPFWASCSRWLVLPSVQRRPVQCTTRELWKQETTQQKCLGLPFIPLSWGQVDSKHCLIFSRSVHSLSLELWFISVFFITEPHCNQAERNSTARVSFIFSMRGESLLEISPGCLTVCVDGLDWYFLSIQGLSC